MFKLFGDQSDNQHISLSTDTQYKSSNFNKYKTHMTKTSRAEMMQNVRSSHNREQIQNAYAQGQYPKLQ